MKSLRHVFLGCALTAALLGGCSAETPNANQPSASAAASPSPPAKYVSKVGNCLNTSGATNDVDYDRSPMRKCEEQFSALVVGTGTFGPQGASIDAMNAAYLECDTMVRTFLKEDWRNGRLKIKIERPASATEPSGERWWECTLQEEGSGSLFNTGTSFAAGIPAGMRYGCQQAVGTGRDVRLAAVECSMPHEAEYAGSVVMPVGTPYPKTDELWERSGIVAACEKVVGVYVGVSPNNVGLYGMPISSEGAWPARRDVRCYAYFGTKTMTTSAKGTKGKGVPW